MDRKCKAFIVLLLFNCLVLSSCGSADTVSREEYDKVVAERDNYKQLYEELTQNNEHDIEETVSNYEYNTELELMTVELTTDNVLDYVQFGIMDERDAFGDLSGYHYVVSYSKVVDDGWYFYATSDDFAIEYVMDDGHTSTLTSLFTTFAGWYNDERNYSEDSVSVSRVQGTVTFVNKNSVTNYVIKDGERTIDFVDGTGHSTSGSGPCEKYPY